jgi:hypothetical protein
MVVRLLTGWCARTVHGGSSPALSRGVGECAAGGGLLTAAGRSPALVEGQRALVDAAARALQA